MIKNIKVDNISFSYPGENSSNLIIDKLNFSINRGCFVAILGPSGCGKTTLLNLLSGFKIPVSGNVLFNGKQITSPFPEGQMIFQDTSQLLPWLSVEENILLPRFRSTFFSRKKEMGKEERDFFEKLLKETSLEAYRKYYPNQLSGGLKQRVSLVRGIFAKSDILFMDEPFVSLDAPSRFELQNLLLNLWKSMDKTIFFVTHDISEALLLSDKIIIFSGGAKDVQIIDNSLNRPRDRDSKYFIKEKLRLYSIIDSI